MKVALIADDLTGANNAGVQLAKQGFPTVTVMHDAASVPDGYDAVCVDSDSRYVSPEEARQRVAASARRMRERGARLLCKRVDTLLRGNVGAEIDGMLDLMPDALAVFAAAFPGSNRVVRDGTLFVDGAPVTDHLVASSDPIAPVRHAAIAKIVASQSRARVDHVTLNVVSAGAAAIARRLTEVAASGARIAIVDAVADDDIAAIAYAMAQLERPLVPVDPGALSAMYARRRFPAAGEKQVLVAVGSVSAITRRQLANVLREYGAEAMLVDAARLAARDHGEEEIRRATDAALRQPGTGALRVITTLDDGAALSLDTLAQREGTSPQVLSKRIAEGLARVSVGIMQASRGTIAGCYSTGGDVTAAIYKAAAATGVKIEGEVMPLTAHVRLVGGTLDGLRMVTKGGSIGGDMTASECLQYLLNEVRRC